jgi:hypothetical protein
MEGFESLVPLLLELFQRHLSRGQEDIILNHSEFK